MLFLSGIQPICWGGKDQTQRGNPASPEVCHLLGEGPAGGEREEDKRPLREVAGEDGDHPERPQLCPEERGADPERRKFSSFLSCQHLAFLSYLRSLSWESSWRSPRPPRRTWTLPGEERRTEDGCWEVKWNGRKYVLLCFIWLSVKLIRDSWPF